jgi:hypothetical protein
MLPGARRLARRCGRWLGWHDAIAEVLVGLVTAVHRFDLVRHEDRIASRLLAAARGQVTRHADRERAWCSRTTDKLDPDTFAGSAAVTRAPAFATAVRAGQLTALDAALIEATRVNGLTLRDAATLLGLNYEAAKKRRRRAEASWVARSAPPSLLRARARAAA